MRGGFHGKEHHCGNQLCGIRTNIFVQIPCPVVAAQGVLNPGRGYRISGFVDVLPYRNPRQVHAKNDLF